METDGNEHNPGDFFNETEWTSFPSPGHLPAAESERIRARVNTGLGSPVRSMLFPALRWAAVVLLLAGIVPLLLLMFRPALAHTPAIASQVVNNTVEFFNSGNRLMELDLSDQSHVQLFPGSRLTLKQPFSGGSRDMELVGKGIFDVAHDSLHPFTVYSGPLITLAVGTKFIVSAFPGEARPSVELLQGKVRVSSSDRKHIVYLRAGQLCRFDLLHGGLGKAVTRDGYAGRKPARDEIGSSPVTPPTDLNFRQTPLPLVFRALTKKFHIPVKYPGLDLDKRKYTGHFPDTVSLRDLLQTIAVLNDLSLTRDTTGFTLSK